MKEKKKHGKGTFLISVSQDSHMLLTVEIIEENSYYKKIV